MDMYIQPYWYRQSHCAPQARSSPHSAFPHPETFPWDVCDTLSHCRDSCTCSTTVRIRLYNICLNQVTMHIARNTYNLNYILAWLNIRLIISTVLLNYACNILFAINEQEQAVLCWHSPLLGTKKFMWRNWHKWEVLGNVVFLVYLFCCSWDSRRGRGRPVFALAMSLVLGKTTFPRDPCIPHASLPALCNSSLPRLHWCLLSMGWKACVH